MIAAPGTSSGAPGSVARVRLRILVFLPCLTLGGAERQAFLVASYLKSRGHEVEAWGFPAPHGRAGLVPELERHGIPRLELASWPTLAWDYARYGMLAPAARWWKWSKGISHLEALIPRRTFDVVLPYTFWPSLAACLMRDRLGADRTFWNHRGGYDGAGILYSGFLVRKVLDRKPFFVANSVAGARFLTDTFRLVAGEVPVVPNAFIAETGDTPGPDAAKGSNAGPAAGAARCRELTLVHVANFYPEKDYDTLLEGLSLLKRGGTVCRLHLCGEFLRDTDRARFERRVRDLGVGHEVVYHGPLPRAAVLGLVSRSDIGLLSSRSEGQPNSVMEAMHAGLPIVGTRIPGIQELVGAEGDEWLFDVGDAEGMARGIARLAGDPALRAEIGERNRHRIHEHYAPEMVLPRWAELVEGTPP
jgi:glycosyltransferase involved in cell wall biosynthesis